jgi:hypothetical protein
MTFEWIVFVTCVCIAWLAIDAYRERTELYAEAITDSAEHIVTAMDKTTNKENENA